MEAVVSLLVPDAGELLTLQRAAYVTEAQAHSDLQLPPLMQSLDELMAELSAPSVMALGLRDAGQRLVAAVRVSLAPTKAVAELGRLVVAPDMQGRGLGGRLLGLVEQRLPREVVELQLFTGEHSPANLRLYTKFGYRETHRTRTPSGYALVHLRKQLR
ncbi:GNAT family N-acetyltransferase [[Mycobacterium] nativiensis]|uniref:GNAT family N-acetyltransferase n=1 Tax=[Mycobacterium] nativiensis TaxID=2855503 RepID=A0ABU5Y1K2_9MYCO|nr:GNAT family N-acetyltransferase [Mycolicibacter sp. MYC340]MEB3034003.1 GNAT family N-acetyltransferase [Mycolicibacter sp. MYC340]